MLVNCDQCGKEVNKKPYQVKTYKNLFCSRECRNTFQTKNVITECACCGKTITKKQFEINSSKTGRVFCSKSCSAKVSNEERSSGTYVYRDRAFRYKAHRCETCGYGEVKEILVVHHIDRNRDNGDISNLQILCPTCHMVEHFNKKDGPFKWSSNNDG